MAELGHPNCEVKFVKADAPAGRAVVQPSISIAPAPASAPASAAPPTAPTKPATPSGTAKEKSASVPFNKDDFKNDPLIQKALEIFKGQIVEVRA